MSRENPQFSSNENNDKFFTNDQKKKTLSFDEAQDEANMIKGALSNEKGIEGTDTPFDLKDIKAMEKFIDAIKEEAEKEPEAKKDMYKLWRIISKVAVVVGLPVMVVEQILVKISRIGLTNGLPPRFDTNYKGETVASERLGLITDLLLKDLQKSVIDPAFMLETIKKCGHDYEEKSKEKMESYKK